MWIELDDSLLQSESFDDLQICTALELVGLSSFQGRHVLYGSTPVLRWALLHQVSPPTQAALKRALARVASFGSLRSLLDLRLTVVLAGDRCVKANPSEWTIPIRLLAESHVPACDLLAENLKDAETYALAARQCAKLMGLKGVQVKLIPQNGGGSQIAPAFIAAIAAKQFSLSITDSDKDYPAATSSAVTSACRTAAEEAPWIAEHRELNCREVENLLPINLVQDAVSASLDAVQIRDNIDGVLKLLNRCPDAGKYLDLKRGVKGHSAYGATCLAPKKGYWKSVVEQCQDLCGIDCDTCDFSSQECKCVIAHGLGEHLLKLFLEHCGTTSLQKQIERVKTSPNKEAWLQIGKLAMSWGIADEPYRA